MQHQREEHPLIEKRLWAALSVVALGVGVGYELMLTRVLIPLGLGLSLASAIGVISIYWKHFRYIYNTLRQRKKYNGPSIVELLVAAVTVVVVLIVSPIIYLNVSNDIILNKANFKIEAVSPLQLPGDKRLSVNFQWLNSGNLTMINSIIAIKGFVANVDDLPSGYKISSVLSDLKSEHDFYLKKQEKSDEIRQGDGRVVTIPDFYIAPDQINEIVLLHSVIYVLFVISYQDEIVRKNNERWEGSFCMYFVDKQKFYHSCGPNRIELVNDK